MISSRKLMIFGLLKMIKESFTFNYLQEVQRKLNNQAQVLSINLEGLEINQGESHQWKEKRKHGELKALASFIKQEKTQKPDVEEIKLEEELARSKARVKTIEEQEELEKSKTLHFFLSPGNQLEYTEYLSFRKRTADNMHSINQNSVATQQ